MDEDSLVALAGELVERPFADGPVYGGTSWLDGMAHSAPEAHFLPLATFLGGHDTPGDFDLTDEAHRLFDRRRTRMAAVLSARWGPATAFSFQPESDRVMSGDDSVPPLIYDLAMFTDGAGFPSWRRGDRLVGLLLGQMDKEFPLVLTLAVLTFPDHRLPDGAAG